MPDLPQVRDGYRWARVESVAWRKPMRHGMHGMHGRTSYPLPELLISNY